MSSEEKKNKGFDAVEFQRKRRRELNEELELGPRSDDGPVDSAPNGTSEGKRFDDIEPIVGFDAVKFQREVRAELSELLREDPEGFVEELKKHRKGH